MVVQSTSYMWHWTIASFLSRKISETERLYSDDIVSRLKGLVITSLTPFWWRNVINSLADSDIDLDTAMLSEGYAPVKVTCHGIQLSVYMNLYVENKISTVNTTATAVLWLPYSTAQR